jgi:hypothetical protein
MVSFIAIVAAVIIQLPDCGGWTPVIDAVAGPTMNIPGIKRIPANNTARFTGFGALNTFSVLIRFPPGLNISQNLIPLVDNSVASLPIYSRPIYQGYITGILPDFQFTRKLRLSDIISVARVGLWLTRFDKRVHVMSCCIYSGFGVSFHEFPELPCRPPTLVRDLYKHMAGVYPSHLDISSRNHPIQAPGACVRIRVGTILEMGLPDFATRVDQDLKASLTNVKVDFIRLRISVGHFMPLGTLGDIGPLPFFGPVFNRELFGVFLDAWHRIRKIAKSQSSCGYICLVVWGLFFHPIGMEYTSFYEQLK